MKGKRKFEFEFKLQVHMPFIYCNYMVMNRRLHCIAYSDARGFTLFVSTAFTLMSRDSFALFPKPAMARVCSTACLHDDAITAGSGGQDSGDSAKRVESVPLSNAGSHSGAGAGDDESASTRSYFFGL
jgi:hypothetical protein